MRRWIGFSGISWLLISGCAKTPLAAATLDTRGMFPRILVIMAVSIVVALTLMFTVGWWGRRRIRQRAERSIDDAGRPPRLAP